MSALISLLREIWDGASEPFMITPEGELSLRDVLDSPSVDLAGINPGDVVCLVGNFDSSSISLLLKLVEREAIVVPLTEDTRTQHKYFFEITQPKAVVYEGRLLMRNTYPRAEGLLGSFSSQKRAGLVLFTSGTTGAPKAILHDFSSFLARFTTPRPALKTLSFLLFDHIGGLNTLFHTLFNRGLVVVPEARNLGAVLDACSRYDIELLPTTPTFLRMLLMSESLVEKFPESLQLVTYGTERMDESTLRRLCSLLPRVEFRQTYGLSEIGILRIKPRARDSLWVRIGGEGIETKIVKGVLHIRSRNRMVGYLNAPDPFDSEGWFDTGDAVEAEGDWIRIIGRAKDVINVGGLKFSATEVEDAALEYPGVALAKAQARKNPVTGSHVELTIEPIKGLDVDLEKLKNFLRLKLEPHKHPMRVRNAKVDISPRWKRK